MKRIFTFVVTLFLVITPLGCTRAPAVTAGSAEPSLASPAEEKDEESAETTTPALDAGFEVTSVGELIAALADPAITKAHISADMTISLDLEQTFEREGFVLTIDTGAEVTIGDGLILVYFGAEDNPGLVVNGTLKVLGSLNFGAMTLSNNGVLEVLSGGVLAPGMSVIENHGDMMVYADGTIRLERGSALRNYATLTNAGEIDITSDGGSLINAANATLNNNGHITFNGDYQNDGTYLGTQLEP